MSLRVLHTADWHLGQTFHSFDRDHEHARFLEWLLDRLEERRPDALLIAGDVFDTINPSATAQRRYFCFLAEARRRMPALQIVITAGNHDAAARLEAPAPLMEALGIAVVGTVARAADGAIALDRFVIPLRNAAGTVEALALAVPFLRPADVPVVADARDAYLDGIRELYRQIVSHAEETRSHAHPGAALIALGHLHLSGGEESRDSERRVVIGGSEALAPDIFPASLAYVALGHLHKPQHFDNGRICYSGSPIPLSFSERDYEHRVLELTFEAGRLVNSKTLPIPRFAGLVRIPDHDAAAVERLPELIAALSLDATRPAEEHPFVEVHILEERPNPELRRTVEQALEGKPLRLALIKRVLEGSERADTLPGLAAAADLNSLQPEDLVADHHREKYGTDPDPAMLQALREIVASLT
jgi:exonuclease SbcD